MPLQDDVPCARASAVNVEIRFCAVLYLLADTPLAQLVFLHLVGDRAEALATDLDGVQRVVNATVDMGAYESLSPTITEIAFTSNGFAIAWHSVPAAM